MKEEVWFDYNGIANIIVLDSVQDHFRVSYSNWFGSDCNGFVVITPDNTKIKFTMSRKGMYYTDTSSLIGQPSKAGVFKIKLHQSRRTSPSTHKGVSIKPRQRKGSK